MVSAESLQQPGAVQIASFHERSEAIDGRQMSTLAVALLVVSGVMLLTFPRRWAPMPLLVGTCYMTLAQGVELGVFSFPFFRLLVCVGLARVLLRREYLIGGVNHLDRAMMLFAGAALITSAFHADPVGQFVFCLGLVFNTCGIYFLFRVLVSSRPDVVLLSKMTALVLVPVALEMFLEATTARNYFAVLGGVPDVPEIREGRVRAQGPFAHAILAGTVGAVSLPAIIGLWPRHRPVAIVGIASCVTIVVTSASSGPIGSLIFGIVGLLMWRARYAMRYFRWAAVIAYVILDVVMKAPPYFLLARIDLTGGSTGWHRAELIDSGLRHFHEWWLWGTDYTRHWMPTGVSWSPDHTDITNHYLQMGVIGGLPLMITFVNTLVRGFSSVGQIVHTGEIASGWTLTDRFMVWSLGAALFSHAATCVSVSYFDQSILFLGLNLAMIGSMWVDFTNTSSGPSASERPEGFRESGQAPRSRSTLMGVTAGR